jgi:hypothetical protein
MMLIFLALLSAWAWADQASEKPEKLLGTMSLFPEDDDLPGWKRSEKLLSASNEEELYKIVNGGAALYIQHGFQSFAGQSYKGPKGVELEVYIFNQGTPQNAQDLYENPFAKPGSSREIPDLGKKARIDMTPLFSYGVDFVQKGFFVRVIMQEKTEEGLRAALTFAHNISKRIMTSTRGGGMKNNEPLKVDKTRPRAD